MTEATLTQDMMGMMRAEMRHAVVLKIAEQTRHGIPDVSCTWRDVSSWWEVKFYNEEPFDSPALQQVTCRQLRQQGICFYVIYELRKGVKRTYIVNPWQLATWFDSPDFSEGWAHGWVAQFIRHQHTLYRPTLSHADNR